MNHSALTIFSVHDAKESLSELLDTARTRPIGITRDDRLAAYLISTATYELMQAKLQELEDQLWLMKAEAARKEGFADQAATDALLHRLAEASDEKADDH